MSEQIDHRVVEMRFDNKQFESGAKQTMGTLAKLKEALKFPDVTKGFDNLQKAANKVDINGLGNAVDSVKLKFSALEVAAVTTLSNIANRAVDAGVRLAKSLSTDQIKSGFGEYELKMGSIQTIMASTGESLETVNKRLEELNEYSDKTIYSFSDMTSNIGKFTNAGVKLDNAVKAIQGISNAAAVAGANSNEASRSMYNFAQALSSGYVKLIDWKSIELANMATVEFKQSLIDTAVAMGTVVKSGDKYQTTTTDLNGNVSELFDATSMFNDSLSAQWMTTDVLVQALNNYSTDVRTMTSAEKKAYEEKLRSIGYTEDQIKSIEELGIKAFDSAQDVKSLTQLLDTMRESVGSGWAQTFELIIGDFEEAKKLWTNVNNTLGTMLNESSVSRNELLRGWKEAGGRDALLAGISNSFNALLSVVNAVKEAFRDVFPKMTSKRLVEITEGFRDLTKQLAPSDKVLKNLKRTFSGLFSILHIVGQAAGAFFKLIAPGVSTIGDLGDGILGVTASLGDWITKLDKSIEENDWFIKAIEKTREIIGDAIDNVEDFANKIGDMFESLLDIKDINIDIDLNNISKAFEDLSWEIENFNLDNLTKSFGFLEKKFQGLYDLLMSNDGFATFLTNFRQFVKDLREAFTLENLLDRVEMVMSVFDKFFNWVKTTMKPAFEEFNFGSAIAAGGGLGIIYALIKVAKSFEKVAKSFKLLDSIKGAVEGVKGVLAAYQNELKAEALIKVAGAIAILAGALVLLSFADTDRLFGASMALSLIAGVLLLGFSKFLEALNKGREVERSMGIFAKRFGSAAKKLGRAMEIRSLGGVIKNFAKSIAIIAASIIGLGVMWRKDPQAFKASLYTVGAIASILVAITGLMTIGSKLGDPKGISSIGKSILLISASLILIVSSINKLMKMQLPEDYGTKLFIIGGIIGGLAALTIILAGAARLAGGKQLPEMAKTIKSLAVLLLSTVLSLKILFAMKLPNDFEARFDILEQIFWDFAILVGAMAVAARVSKGQGFKAASTILALTGFLVVVVGSLFILSIIPTEKLLKGAIALGVVLVTLGTALAGAGRISDKESSKAVLSMAITIGAIVASLAILTMIPLSKLAKSVVSLGAVLLVLAKNFEELSKVKSKNALPAVIAMIGATITIATSLYVLSKQPWENLIAAAVSMSATLLAFSKSFETILGKRWSENNVKKIGTFLLLTLAVIPIGVALGVLANQPWEGLLTATAALSATLLVLTECFAIISKVKVDLKSMAAVVAGSASLILIAAGISMLTKYDGEQLLNSCLALASILTVMIGVMAACSALSGVIGPAMAGVLGLGAVIAELGLVLAALGGLAQIPGLKWLIGEGGDLLQEIGTAIGKFIGGIIGGVLVGTTSQLPQVGIDLSKFIVNLTPFLDGVKNIDKKVLAGVTVLTGAIIALTAAEVINGIARLLGFSLLPVAVELSAFMTALQPFVSQASKLKPESIEACGYLANMIIKLTAADLISGIGRILGIRGSLTEFGKELSEFGPYIKEFAETVKDVKPEAVQGTAAAAEMMSNLSKKLPGTGGFYQKIFGTKKTLSEFGKELSEFGPYIKEFAETVKDVNSDAVQGAISAASMMMELGNKLPSTNGFYQKLFGTKKNLADFGVELVSFGPNIASFANIVKDIKEESVTGVQSITSIMTALANDLPDSDSLWDKVFGGGQISISEFGLELKDFGVSMSEFSASISNVNGEKINTTIESFKKLADMALYVKDVSVGDLVFFSDELGSIGLDAVDKFVQAFSGADQKVIDAFSVLQNSVVTSGQNVVLAFINGVNAKKPLALSSVFILCTNIINKFKVSLPNSTFRLLGENIIIWLSQGINDKKPLALSSVFILCTNIINKFKVSLPNSTFRLLGENIIIWLSQGINDKAYLVENSSVSICNSIIQAFSNNLSQSRFKEIGANAALGLKYGIESKINDISEAAIKAANEAVESAKRELDEHSPSKVAWKIGEFFSLGLAKGILNGLKEVSMAGKKAADEAANPLNKSMSIISEVFDSTPVIRPVIDLSNIEKGARDIASLMNRTYDLSSIYDKAIDVSSSFVKTSEQKAHKDNGMLSIDKGDTYEFNQYNYSPKALPRSEIFRQTNNQFSAFKKAVNSI